MLNLFTRETSVNLKRNSIFMLFRIWQMHSAEIFQYKSYTNDAFRHLECVKTDRGLLADR